MIHRFNDANLLRKIMNQKKLSAWSTNFLLPTTIRLQLCPREISSDFDLWLLSFCLGMAWNRYLQNVHSKWKQGRFQKMTISLMLDVSQQIRSTPTSVSHFACPLQMRQRSSNTCCSLLCSEIFSMFDLKSRNLTFSPAILRFTRTFSRYRFVSTWNESFIVKYWNPRPFVCQLPRMKDLRLFRYIQVWRSQFTRLRHEFENQKIDQKLWECF